MYRRGHGAGDLVFIKRAEDVEKSEMDEFYCRSFHNSTGTGLHFASGVHLQATSHFYFQRCSCFYKRVCIPLPC